MSELEPPKYKSRPCPSYDADAFQAWARERFDIPDDAVRISPGFYETAACVWVSRPNSERGWGLTSDHYLVPEVPTIEALCAKFPKQPEVGQQMLEIL